MSKVECAEGNWYRATQSAMNSCVAANQPQSKMLEVKYSCTATQGVYKFSRVPWLEDVTLLVDV